MLIALPIKTHILIYFENVRKIQYELQSFEHSGQVSLNISILVKLC
jgi:hypothetical protein